MTSIHAQDRAEITMASEISKFSILAQENSRDLFHITCNYTPVYASKPMILQIVTKFLRDVVDISKECILEDVSHWVRKINFDINITCCYLENWTTFMEILAHKLGTSYSADTEYFLILKLLTNAAYLRRFPECPNCAATISIEPNFVVFTCKECRKSLFGK